MNDAARRRGLALIAWCALVGALAAFGPVTSIDSAASAAPQWIPAIVGATLAGGAAWLAWSRLSRLAGVAAWGRIVAVSVVASIGALAGAAVAAGVSETETDPTPIVVEDAPAESSAGGASSASPSDGEGQRWTDIGGLEGSIVLTVGLILLIAAAVFFGRQSELRAVPVSPKLLRSHLSLDDDEDPSPAELATALGRTRAALLGDDDPRTAVRSAYRQLLVELESIGLPRRTYEAPVEYLTRCFGDRRLPESPMRELTAVFELARFSEHPIDRSHVRLAERLLDDATTALTADALPDA